MIELREIHFHGVSGGTIPLRRNESSGSEFRPPEWIPGRSRPEDSPAAYVAGAGGIGLGIRLERPGGGPAEQVEIWADDASQDGNLLGSVVRQTVVFEAGETAKCVRVAVTGAIPPRVTRHDDSLRWKILAAGVERVLATTSHRIYVVLGLPGQPWGADDADADLWTWTGVLDLACCWAKWARTPDEAANAVTERLSKLGEPGAKGFTFDSEDSGLFAKCMPFVFQCELFLSFANQSIAEAGSVHVDCLACSSILATLANSLGCALWEAYTEGGINSVHVRPIGERLFAFHSIAFHELAAGGDAAGADRVWDGCFRLEGGGNSGTAVGGLVFDTAGTKDYAGMLFSAEERPLCSYLDRDQVRVNRAVMQNRAPDVPLPLEIVKRLGDEVFDRFMKDDREQSPLFVYNFFWTPGDLPGFRLVENPERDSFHGAVARWSQGRDSRGRGARVAVYEAASRYEARQMFVARLMEYTRPVEELTGVGEFAFHDPERGYKVALAGNTVWTSMPDPGAGLVGDAPFHAVDGWIRPPGAKPIPGLDGAPSVPLDLPTTDPTGAPLWYVLRPENGSLTREGSRMVFTPVSGGRKRVDVATHRDAEDYSNSTIEL